MKIFRYIFFTIIFLFFCLSLSAQNQGLISKLEEYVSTIKYESIEVQNQECDFLIETCTDTLVRKEVALWLYDHYAKSPIMGFETVAIHIYDNWFANRKIPLDEASLLGAKIFAEFNRQSLIGCKAPELRIEDINGLKKNLFESPSEEYKILYFYDNSCPKCELETLLLTRFLEKKAGGFLLYTFYLGDNRELWEAYVADKFPKTDYIEHFWDPMFDSDYQRKYGVLQSPRMFLIDTQDVIVGRGLDTSSLEQLLEQLDKRDNYAYGSEESTNFYNKFLSSFGKELKASDIVAFAQSIETQTLPGNVNAYKQLIGDLLYYLVPHYGEQYKLALTEIIEKHIISREDIWTTEADSLKVVGMAKMMSELLALPATGSKIPSFKLPGTLLKNGKARDLNKYLHKLGGKENYILFYTEGCQICDAEKEAAKLLSKTRGIQIFMINLDELVENQPELADLLFDSFDLSSLPFILQTNRKGLILRKYLSLIPIL